MEKQKLKDLINNTLLFDINKEKDPERYEKERKKFFDILVKYFFKQQKNYEYGAILIITADRCLKSYDKSKGKFLNYLNRAFKIEKGKQIQQDKQMGIKIPQKCETLFNKIYKYAKTRNLDLNDIKVQHDIAKVLKLDIHRVQKLIQIYIGQGIITTTQDKDGKEISIVDLLADKIIDIEDTCIENESIESHLKLINTLFEKQQERQKKLLSMLITNRLCEALEDIEKFNKFSFYNNKIAMHNKQGMKYTQKEIGELCKKSEVYTSKVWKKFRNKLNQIK